MQTCHRSWILGSIAAFLTCGCGDLDTSSPTQTETPSAQEALLSARPAAAVRTASQVEFNATELARLALHRSHDKAVLRFAQSMLDAHVQNHRSLRRVAAAHGFKVATVMDVHGQTTWSALFSQSGTPFDTAFVDVVRKLQKQGRESVAQLQKQDPSEALAAWCATAAATWNKEETASGVDGPAKP